MKWMNHNFPFQIMGTIFPQTCWGGGKPHLLKKKLGRTSKQMWLEGLLREIHLKNSRRKTTSRHWNTIGPWKDTRFTRGNPSSCTYFFLGGPCETLLGCLCCQEILHKEIVTKQTAQPPPQWKPTEILILLAAHVINKKATDVIRLIWRSWGHRGWGLGDPENNKKQPFFLIFFWFLWRWEGFFYMDIKKKTSFFGLALPPMNILIKLCEGFFLCEDCCLHACLKLFDDKNIRFQSYPATFQNPAEVW